MWQLIKRYWIGLLWLAAWYFHDKFSVSVINNAYLIAFLITIGKMLYDSYDGFFKYKTAQVIMNNMHFSHFGPLLAFDRYYLISLGDSPYFFTKASEGWLVVPRSAVVMIGEQIFINARVQRVRLVELPLPVYQYFRRRRYEGRVYYGEITEDQQGIINVDNVKISVNELTEFIISQNRLINILNDLLRKDSSAISEYTNLASNMYHSLNVSPSILDKLLGRKRERDD